MKILSAQKIKEGDAYTIKHEPISSVDLMERAGECCFRWIYDRAPNLFPDQLDERDYAFKVFCGVGNNGGDGLVIARLLNRNGYDVEVFIVDFSDKQSDDFKTNLQRIAKSKMGIHRIKKESDIPEIPQNALVIDAMFGTGISRKVEGIAGSVIRKINQSGAVIVAIDMPSGLFDEDNSENDRETIVNANYTLTFQFLKLAFLLGENVGHVGQCEVLDIGLHPDFVESVETDRFYLTPVMVRSIVPVRNKFSHKGTFGHSAVIAGSKGKYGAAILCTRGAVHSGSGLVTTILPQSGIDVLQVSVPEAMAYITKGVDHLEGMPDLEPYSAIGMGPGMGTSSQTQKLVHDVLKNAKVPVVVDADAVNALAENPEWKKLLRPEIVLTPHPGEFKRLVGEWNNDFEKLEKQVAWAMANKVHLVLKGAHTSVATPDGKVYINSTGNPGMATGGSGDVLTGIITGLLAQGYSPRDAAVAGVFLHGKSGDLASENNGHEALVASDLIKYLGKAFLSLNLPSNS